MQNITKDMGILGRFNCTRCHNTGDWRLLKVTAWFTLFFIPLIPVHTDYYSVCPVCHGTTRMTKQEFEKALKDKTGRGTL